MTHVAIFASGTGSNAQKIINYFKNSVKVQISLIVCNNKGAGVLKIAVEENIPVLLIERQIFILTGYISELQKQKIEFIVLAGFLWKIPPVLIEAFKNKIINIHPALLPAHGGKGMYGNAVHAAVLAANEKQSGITIHFVDEKYDHGKIIFQSICPVSENETVDSLSQKIHELEHQFYATEIEKLIDSKENA
ncbi:MAG TPA: phosphoribosylglycinamide formyltransferase [Ginsengibacter sp.]